MEYQHELRIDLIGLTDPEDHGMSEPCTKWLEQLERATNYAELQSIFTQISDAAQSTADGGQFAQAIDMAIQRIEQERSRDQQELDQRDGNYSAFKQEQGGFTGWIKRHIPFSETRRQDRDHRERIDEQQAEILADNLIIARAQMLKERLLPADQRCTGHVVDEWRNRLRANESVAQLRDYAESLLQIDKELSCSDAFVQELATEINAFAKAKFSSEDDQRRQRSDLQASRSELANLQTELDNKRELFTAAIETAGELVKQDLISGNPDFDRLHREIAQWEHCLSQWKHGERPLSELNSVAKNMQELLSKRLQMESEIETCSVEIQRMTGQADATEHLCLTARNSHAEYSGRYQVAQRAAQHSQAAWQAVKQRFEAQGSIPQAEVSSQPTIDPDPQLASEYQRLKSEQEFAQEQLKIATAPFESARSELQSAEKSLEKLRADLNAHAKRWDELTKAKQQTHAKLIEHEQEVWRKREQVERWLVDYRNALALLDYKPPSMQSVADHHRLPPPSMFAEFQERSTPTSSAEKWVMELADTYQGLAKSLESDQRELKKQLSSLRQEMQQAWTKRCHELLGSQLAQQVCK